jgi:NAD(P)-dependent dehydrogenase (short-subunit alcohol dehydrogenase family)
VCIDIDMARIDAALSDDLPGEIVKVSSDLSSLAVCLDIVGRIDGEIHGLVHLAGILARDEDMAADPTQWDRVINANVRNAYDLVAAMVSRLPAGPRPAKFVFTTSLAFRRGAPENVTYAIAKAGLVGLTRSLAKRFGPRATVNAVAPGLINTSMPADFIRRHRERLIGEIPMRRFGEPVDVAKVIAFLTSPASDYVTGQVVNVDGGMVTS